MELPQAATRNAITPALTMLFHMRRLLVDEDLAGAGSYALGAAGVRRT
jgi:hypothetical protein